jgi:hypothetical protein
MAISTRTHLELWTHTTLPNSEATRSHLTFSIKYIILINIQTSNLYKQLPSLTTILSNLIYFTTTNYYTLTFIP